MNRFLLICFVLHGFIVNIEGDCNVQGYYWRDFKGIVPDDAFPGGRDKQGNWIYIGQVFNLQFLIPAKIYLGNPTAYYEYGGHEFNITDNIKIFCSQHPEKFEWLETNNDDIKLLANKHLVLGGYEPGCTTYIGRVRFEGELLVGKALADNDPRYAGLHTTSNGKGTRHTSFEVLAYDSEEV